MIKNFYIENFKAFGKMQKLPIKPITLLFGPNSSGKSSLIHALLYGQNAIETGDLNPNLMKISGDSVDLGGFYQFIFEKNVESSITWAVDLEISKFEERLKEFFKRGKILTIKIQLGESSYKLHQKENKKSWDYSDSSVEPDVSVFSLEIDNKVILSSNIRINKNLKISRLVNDHPFFRNILKSLVESSTTSNLLKDDRKIIAESILELLGELEIEVEYFFPNKINIDQSQARSEILFPVSKSYRSDDLNKAIRFYMPRILNEILEGLFNHLKKNLNNIKYLGPLRSFPPRFFALSPSNDPNWYSGGGFAWQVLIDNPYVREKVNKWLGNDKLQTPYELVVHHYFERKKIDNPILDGLEKLESYFINPPEDQPFQDLVSKGSEFIDDQLQFHLDAPLTNLVLKDLRTNTEVSHRDIGIGISQILPVLVSAYANEKKIICVEQPELHIHPALQAELGDVFIESALGKNKNTFILETHSEHLILRILRRIRESSENTLPKKFKKIKPNDIAVIYAKPTKEGTVLHELKVNEEGEFIEKWPDGFFAERADELF